MNQIKKIITDQDRADTLSDPKCGTYFEKSRERYVCIAKIQGEFIEIGSYTTSLVAQGGKPAKTEAERKIWGRFLFGDEIKCKER